MTIAGIFTDVTAHVSTEQYLQIYNGEQPYSVSDDGGVLNGLSLTAIDNTIQLSGQTSLVHNPQNFTISVQGSDGKSAQSSQAVGSVSTFSFFLQGWFYSGPDTRFKTVQAQNTDTAPVGNYVCASKDGKYIYSLSGFPYSVNCLSFSKYGYYLYSNYPVIGSLNYFSWISCSDDASIIVASISGNTSGLNVFKKVGVTLTPLYQADGTSDFKAGGEVVVSPDGKYVVCAASTSDFKPSIWAISDSGISQISGDRPPGDTSCHYFTWFPDSRTFVYVDLKPTASSNIGYLCRLDPDSGVSVLQTIDGISDIVPSTGNIGISSPFSISNDGDYLYVSMASDPFLNVYRYDGSTLVLQGGATGVPSSVMSGVVLSKNSNYALITASGTSLYTYSGADFAVVNDLYLYGNAKTYLTPFLM